MRRKRVAWLALIVAVAVASTVTDINAAEKSKSASKPAATKPATKKPAPARSSSKSTSTKSSKSSSSKSTSAKSSSKSSSSKSSSSKSSAAKSSSKSKPADARKAAPAVVPKPEKKKDPIPSSTDFDSGRISFELRYSGIAANLDTLSAFVLPGETLEVEAAGGSGLFAASSRTGKLVADPKKAIWRWKAPAVSGGKHEIRIRDRGKKNGDVAMLHVFVMRPYDDNITIGDYPIGSYREPLKADTAYESPAGFVAVNHDNEDTPVSPHFKLGQFVCKDDFEGTKYLILQPKLLLKLELILEELAQRGFAARTLQVMSGFRTPAYNAEIGNETQWSRHLYGDAADVFLDRDENNEMDDLDGDGESTREDAMVLYHIVENVIEENAESGPMVGGLSAYRGSGVHGSFVHVDTRGRKIRW